MNMLYCSLTCERYLNSFQVGFNTKLKSALHQFPTANHGLRFGGWPNTEQFISEHTPFSYNTPYKVYLYKTGDIVVPDVFTPLCCSSERRDPLFTASARGPEQVVTRGPFTLLPPGKVQTNKVHSQTELLSLMTFLCEAGFLLFSTQNQSNTLTLPIQCTINVASYRDITVRIAGALRIDTLHAVSKLHYCHQ